MVRKALLVGINKYKYVIPLNGCVSDVCNLADILTSVYGFSVDEIRTIVKETCYYSIFQDMARRYRIVTATNWKTVLMKFRVH